jgi:hypothetical protein
MKSIIMFVLGSFMVVMPYNIALFIPLEKIRAIWGEYLTLATGILGAMQVVGITILAKYVNGEYN